MRLPSTPLLVRRAHARRFDRASQRVPTHLKLSTLARVAACPAMLLVCASSLAQAPEAQPDDADNPAQEEQAGDSRQGDSADPGTSPDGAADDSAETADDAGDQPPLMETQQRRTRAFPQQPQGPDADTADSGTPLPVSVNAGIGSDLAYARRSIVEIGGTLALVHESETTTFEIAPQVGYFIVDNIELSLFPFLRVTHLDDETDVSVGAILEPSYHLPISDRIYVFAGVGLGLAYQEGPGFELLLRPRIGLDGLVGRSGLFKPTLFIDVGLDDGAVAGGAQAGFTVIL